MDIPKPIYTQEKDLNFLIKGIINAVKKSKTEKPLLALTDAKPSMNIRKTLFKKENEKDSEALLKQLIKSTTIPKPEKEKVLLALTNTPHSSNKVIDIIENHLGHKVTDIIPFLSQPASSSSSSSSSSAQPVSIIKHQEGEASSSKKLL